DRYVERFRDFEAGLNGQRRPPLHAVRAAAIERFAELGFPTTRSEEWKYTSVAPIARTPFALASRSPQVAGLRPVVEQFAAGLGAGSAAGLLVFVNGFYSPELSLLLEVPGSVRAMSLAAALEQKPESLEGHLARHASFQQEPFVALNTAFLRDGAFIQ